MSLANHLAELEKDVDETIKEIREHRKDNLPPEEAKAIIDTMQSIEDKLSDLLAAYGVEIGDERVD